MQGLFLPILFLCFISCNQFAEHKEKIQTTVKKEIYYCPMHPEIQQDHPGTCPKPECKGMELIKKEPEGILDMVLQPANATVLSNVKTIHPEKKEIELAIKAQGYIDYDERTRHDIPAIIDGRIEKLYVKYNYQPIHKGQRVFDIYSPELVTAQQNLVFLLNTDKDATDLIDAAKQKLNILGMNDADITHLMSDRKVLTSVPVYSKWSGHIHEMKAVSETGESNSPQNMSMNATNTSLPVTDAGNSSNTQMTTPLSVKEGMYVSRGQTVLNVVDPQSVVVMLQIKGQDIAKVKENQKVTLEMDETPQMTMESKISFIEPFLKGGNTTLLARANIDNSGHKHKVGSLVKAIIQGEVVEGLWIPASAVVDLGKSKIAWVKKDGRFMAQKIETGVITKDWIEVTDGLSTRNEIAIEGHYLTDSEGFIKITNNE